MCADGGSMAERGVHATPPRPRDGATILAGGRVLTANGWSVADVAITNGRIVDVAARIEPDSGDDVLSVRGRSIAPGLIDLQINGGYGIDLTTDPASVWALGALLVRHGVTAFLPTVITAPAGAVADARSVLTAGPPRGYRGAIPLGLHVEGPMLSSQRSGTHDPGLLRQPSDVDVRSWRPKSGVRMVTLAPELPDAEAMIELLTSRGVVVGLGHSAATYDEAMAGFRAGATVGTHLFNAMGALHHREPGLVGAVLDHPHAVATIIADGIHAHPAVIRTAWRAKGPDGMALVTDAMAAMGMGHGEFVIGNVDVRVTASGPRNLAGALAGSVLCFDDAIRNLVAFTGCSPAEAIAAASATPARILGDTTRGVVEAGALADLVVFDEELNVQRTFVGGALSYDADATV